MTEMTALGVQQQQEKQHDGLPLLSEDEAALYDRQLRVWGVAAQKKLSAGRLLILKMSPTLAEACKNLVLAGVGALTLLDDGELVSSERAADNFLIPPLEATASEERAATVAEQCAASLREFNPMVSIRTLKASSQPFPLLLSAVDLSPFDALLLGPCTRQQQLQVSEICRMHGPPLALFCVRSLGLSGEIFLDLIRHRCTEKEASFELVYPSLQQALQRPWSEYPRKVPPVLLAFRVLDELEAQDPLPSDLEAFTRQLLSSKGVKARKLDQVPAIVKNLVASNSNKEYPPVAAIMGGFLAQEVVRFLSNKGKTMMNFFHFSALLSEGHMTNIGGNQISC